MLAYTPKFANNSHFTCIHVCVCVYTQIDFYAKKSQMGSGYFAR